MGWATEKDEQVFTDAFMAQKNVRLRVNFAESAKWKNKVDGKEYSAVKLTLDLDDDSVRCERADSRPRRTITDQFNLDQYPYKDKDGNLKKLARQKVYQLEEAFGFEPVFMVGGERVEAHVTKNGNKVAPKIDGVTRVPNPDFVDAYFNSDDSPKMENWAGKTLYADVAVEQSEQYGDKNVVSKYVKAPTI